MPWVADGELDRRGQQETLDLGHRRDQPVALPRAERLEYGGGSAVGAPVKLGSLGQPGAGQAGRADPRVIVARLDDHHPVALE